MSRDCPERRQNRGPQGQPSKLTPGMATGAVVNTALVDTDSIYPEGFQLENLGQEGCSGEIGIEVHTNMVEAYNGWIGDEHIITSDKLVTAIDGQSKSPERSTQQIHEYRS